MRPAWAIQPVQVLGQPEQHKKNPSKESKNELLHARHIIHIISCDPGNNSVITLLLQKKVSRLTVNYHSQSLKTETVSASTHSDFLITQVLIARSALPQLQGKVGGGESTAVSGDWSQDSDVHINHISELLFKFQNNPSLM